MILVSAWTFVLLIAIAVAQEGGLLKSILNSVQMAAKTAVDQFLPQIDLPDVIPPSFDINLPGVRLPVPLGANGLVFPVGCPKCSNINQDELSGTWYMVYASDNFIRMNLLHMAQYSVEPLDTSSGQDQPAGLPGRVDIYNPETLKNLINPMRMPICVRLQFGKAMSYGFLTDYPALISMRMGVPSAPRLQMLGRFRQVSEGKYTLSLAGGRYLLRLCAVESNIAANVQLPSIENVAGLGSLIPRLPPNISGGFGNLQNFNGQNLENILTILNKAKQGQLASAATAGPRPPQTTTPVAPATPVPVAPPPLNTVENTSSDQVAADSRFVKRVAPINNFAAPINNFPTQINNFDYSGGPPKPRVVNGVVIMPAQQESVPRRSQQRRDTVANDDVAPPPGGPEHRDEAGPRPSAPLDAPPPRPLPQPADAPRPVPKPGKFLVLADTSGFPACQNFVVLTTDPWEFFALYDKELVHAATRLGGNSDVNPLHYIPCPCGHEEM